MPDRCLRNTSEAASYLRVIRYVAHEQHPLGRALRPFVGRGKTDLHQEVHVCPVEDAFVEMEHWRVESDVSRPGEVGSINPSSLWRHLSSIMTCRTQRSSSVPLTNRKNRLIRDEAAGAHRIRLDWQY